MKRIAVEATVGADCCPTTTASRMSCRDYRANRRRPRPETATDSRSALI